MTPAERAAREAEAQGKPARISDAGALAKVVALLRSGGKTAQPVR